MCKYCSPIRAGMYASPLRITKWPNTPVEANSRAQILDERGVDNIQAIVLYCGLVDEPVWEHSGVPIKYCPWCGNKLEVKSE